MKKVLAVIPARYGSKRFEGKVLYPFKGKPLIYYLYKELQKSKKITNLVIATDDKRIEDAALSFGAEVVKTGKKHKTGSDRTYECWQKIGGDSILNIQADNFGLKAASVDLAIEQFSKLRNYEFATLVKRITDDNELFDPNIVKAVADLNSDGLLFTRFPVPYLQNAEQKNRSGQFKFLKHIGVYFFKPSGLKKYNGWSRSSMEKAESLEQMRILENGGKIKLFPTRNETVSVDSIDDMKKIERLYK